MKTSTNGTDKKSNGLTSRVQAIMLITLRKIARPIGLNSIQINGKKRDLNIETRSNREACTN